ncbi:MAG: hypothetical protein QF464_15975, partial [Myxococcota bacterium]|nr:hypothetical protein [Myxococcota bacterium]
MKWFDMILMVALAMTLGACSGDPVDASDAGGGATDDAMAGVCPGAPEGMHGTLCDAEGPETCSYCPA